jgi:hypothetical protein
LVSFSGESLDGQRISPAITLSAERLGVEVSALELALGVVAEPS